MSRGPFRRGVLRCAVVGLVFGLVVTSPWLQQRFLEGYTAWVNLALAQFDQGQQIASRLRPAPPDLPRLASDMVHTDTFVELEVPSRGHAKLGISLRRDVYLPWASYLALILASPLGRRQRVRSCIYGSALIMLVGSASMVGLVELLVARQLPDLYQPSAGWRMCLEAFDSAWLTPPGNRAIAPVLLAALALASGFDGLEARPARKAARGAITAPLEAGAEAKRTGFC
jgi:hypothetical protein